jgi:hypothetical protein
MHRRTIAATNRKGTEKSAPARYVVNGIITTGGFMVRDYV